MRDKYKGMTVNERLYESDLDDKFYKAVQEKDVDKAISILKSVDLNDEAIGPILEGLGLHKKIE